MWYFVSRTRIPSCADMQHSDHVFFFSYTQPQQKGGVLGMWSDADALAKVNCKPPTPFHLNNYIH